MHTQQSYSSAPNPTHPSSDTQDQPLQHCIRRRMYNMQRSFRYYSGRKKCTYGRGIYTYPSHNSKHSAENGWEDEDVDLVSCPRRIRSSQLCVPFSSSTAAMTCRYASSIKSAVDTILARHNVCGRPGRSLSRVPGTEGSTPYGDHFSNRGLVNLFVGRGPCLRIRKVHTEFGVDVPPVRCCCRQISTRDVAFARRAPPLNTCGCSICWLRSMPKPEYIKCRLRPMFVRKALERRVITTRQRIVKSVDAELR